MPSTLLVKALWMRPPVSAAASGDEHGEIIGYKPSMFSSSHGNNTTFMSPILFIFYSNSIVTSKMELLTIILVRHMLI